MNNIEILITNNNTKLTDIEWNVQQSLKNAPGATALLSEHELDHTRSERFDNTLATRQDGGFNATGGSGATMNMNMPSSGGSKPMPDYFSAKKTEFKFIPETKLWGAQAFVYDDSIYI